MPSLIRSMIYIAKMKIYDLYRNNITYNNTINDGISIIITYDNENF